MIGGERRGPADIEQLAEMGLLPTDYVWCKGMADWTRALEVADICRFYRRRLHDRLHPTLPAPQAAGPSPEEERPANYYEVRRQITTHYATHPEEDDSSAIPPSHCPLWLILVAILCFFPLGFVALAANRMVTRALANHDLDGARNAARRARFAAGMAVCVGVMVWATIIRFL